MVFHILETAGSGKITSQNDHKNGFYTGWSKICIHLRQLEVPKKYIFLFLFFWLYLMKILYLEVLLNLPFPKRKMTVRHIFLTVFNKMCPFSLWEERVLFHSTKPLPPYVRQEIPCQAQENSSLYNKGNLHWHYQETPLLLHPGN